MVSVLDVLRSHMAHDLSMSDDIQVSDNILTLPPSPHDDRLITCIRQCVILLLQFKRIQFLTKQ